MNNLELHFSHQNIIEKYGAMISITIKEIKELIKKQNIYDKSLKLLSIENESKLQFSTCERKEEDRRTLEIELNYQVSNNGYAFHINYYEGY